MIQATSDIREIVDGKELVEILSSRPGNLFAILDACDEPLVPAKVQQLGPERAISLYRGRSAVDYVAIAPYLVQVDPELLTWIMANLWDKPWGIFALSNTSLAAIRQHFRKFLKVTGPEGDELYFRFYDPRVLPVFLATCSPEDYRQFLGPVERFYVRSG